MLYIYLCINNSSRSVYLKPFYLPTSNWSLILKCFFFFFFDWNVNLLLRYWGRKINLQKMPCVVPFTVGLWFFQYVLYLAGKVKYPSALKLMIATCVPVVSTLLCVIHLHMNVDVYILLNVTHLLKYFSLQFN